MPDYASASVHGARYGYDPYAASDVGWFGEDIYRGAKKGIKSAAKVVKSAAKTVSKAPGLSLIKAPYALAYDVARGKNVARSVMRQGRGIVADTRRSLPLAAGVVSFVPGVGTGVAAGLSAVDAVSRGRSIKDIGLAIARGAIPGGAIAQAAFNALQAGLNGQNLAGILEAAARGALPRQIVMGLDFARDALRGKNLATIALNTAAKAFAPGSQAEKGFGQAAAILKSGVGTVDALKRARSALGSEEARRAFDAAVGTVSKAAEQAKIRPMPKLSVVPRDIARFAGRQTLPKFRPVTPRGASLLANAVRSVSVAALQGRRETAGLEQDGAVYRVENGDNAWAIAKKLVGDGNRWRELVKANPQKPKATDGNFKTLYAKIDVLTLPVSWRQQVKPTLQADALSQARAILKVWSDSDGLNQAGVTQYGAKPEDSSLTWGPRDRLMLISFLTWMQSVSNSTVPPIGDLSTAAADALRAWLAKHSAAPTVAPAPMAPPPAAATVPAQPDPVTFQSVGLPQIPPNAPAASATPAPPNAPPATTAQPIMGADVQAQLAALQQAPTPESLRFFANEMQRRGFPDVADKLNAQADALEAQAMGVPNSSTVPVTVTVGKPTTATAAAKKDDGGGLLLAGALLVAKLAGMF